MTELPNESVLYQAHPAMFRSHPIGFILSVVLIAAFGLGLLILLFWWLSCHGTQLTVTDKRTQLRTGLLSKNTNEVWHADVNNIQTNQRFLQRIFGVGRIGISSAGQSGIEIEVEGVPDPERIKDIIDRHRG